MRTNRIKLLMEYANKKKLLPATGNKLYWLQFEAFAESKAYLKELKVIEETPNTVELCTLSYSEQWEFWRIYQSQIQELNNKYKRREPAQNLNYFYSLLNNAAKAKQIDRRKENGVYIYFKHS